MKATLGAPNVAYGEDEKRGFVTLNLISLAVTPGSYFEIKIRALPSRDRTLAVTSEP